MLVDHIAKRMNCIISYNALVSTDERHLTQINRDNDYWKKVKLEPEPIGYLN